MNSWYNSLVADVPQAHEPRRGVHGQLHADQGHDGGQVPGQFGTFNGTDSPIDPYNRKLEYARCDLDQRHRFVGNVVWIPAIRQEDLEHAAALPSGWLSLSSIVTIGTGQPVTGIINGNPAGAIAGGLTGGAVNNSGTATGGRSRTGAQCVHRARDRRRGSAHRPRVHFHGAGEALLGRRSVQPLQPHQLFHREHDAVHLHRAGSGVCGGTCERLPGPGHELPDADATNNNVLEHANSRSPGGLRSSGTGLPACLLRLTTALPGITISTRQEGCARIVINRLASLDQLRRLLHRGAGIGIPVEARKIAARNLQPDPMPLQEHVARYSGIYSHTVDLPGRGQFRLLE